MSLVPEFLESLNFNALLALGTQLLNEGSQNQAITYFERATLLNPASVDAWYGLGLVYEGNEVYPPAVHAFEVVVKLDLKNADGWLHLSAARSLNGDDEGCKEAMCRWKVLTGSQWPPNL